MHVTAIIAAAGAGRRLGAAVPKQLLELGGRTILERSIDAFITHPRVDDVIVVVPAELLASPPAWLRGRTEFRALAGGARRQDSVANGFDAVAGHSDVVLVHDAARPFVAAELISQSIDAALAHGAAVVAQPVRDTVKRVAAGDGGARVVETLPRESIFLAQTPQAFRRDVLHDAVALGRSGVDATDEAALAERAGHAVHIVEGRAENVKITTADDLERARQSFRDWPARAASAGSERGTQRERDGGVPSSDGLSGAGGAKSPGQRTGRVGTGYDLHRLVEGRRLVLGGVVIPFERGALGHSDADVICHAATDAVLGGACLGDIGRHFPDTDPQWRDASSIDLLRHAAGLVIGAGYTVVNLDVVVILERPKIAPFLADIRERLAAAIGIASNRVSVKGKTNEGVGAVGRGEAVAAHAVALLAG